MYVGIGTFTLSRLRSVVTVSDPPSTSLGFTSLTIGQVCDACGSADVLTLRRPFGRYSRVSSSCLSGRRELLPTSWDPGAVLGRSAVRQRPELLPDRLRGAAAGRITATSSAVGPSAAPAVSSASDAGSAAMMGRAAYGMSVRQIIPSEEVPDLVGAPCCLQPLVAEQQLGDGMYRRLLVDL